ncbi:MAG: hypothetical protein R2756_08235 [Bacteroidales bacterium]
MSFINDLHAIDPTSISNILHLDFTMSDVFTQEELSTLWQASNFKRYYYFTGQEPGTVRSCC